MRLAAWAALAILLTGAIANQARAQPAAADPDNIQLEVLDCAGVSGASVRELVALEVAPRRVLALGSVEPAATRA